MNSVPVHVTIQNSFILQWKEIKFDRFLISFLAPKTSAFKGV